MAEEESHGLRDNNTSSPNGQRIHQMCLWGESLRFLGWKMPIHEMRLDQWFLTWRFLKNLMNGIVLSSREEYKLGVYAVFPSLT